MSIYAHANSHVRTILAKMMGEEVTAMSNATHMSKMTRWRAASLIAVHVLFVFHFVHWKVFGRTLAPVEPSEAFDTLHLGVITVGFLFLASAALLTSMAGRFFCGWGCHILALQDLSAWMLARLNIPTKPIRSRVLLWVPALAAIYLLAWPQVKRLIAGEPPPALTVVSEAGAWTSFTTTDLLRSFPGVGMTLFTFAVCGFALIYFLGSRSFCSYACPYGAIFAAAERLAPLRIAPGPGHCSDCGLCISSCKSSVQVITEIRQFGAVVDANCMKDLDCVSVCPTGALRYGMTKPSLFRTLQGPTKAGKKYDFSIGEDLLMAGVFIGTLPVLRDLYDAIPFLLALALSSLLAYFAVVVVRMVRQQQVLLRNFVLKSAGKTTVTGKGFVAFAVVLAVFILHGAFVRYHLFAGELAAERTRSPQTLAGYGPDAAGAADTLPGIVPAVDANSIRALAHFQLADRWGIVHTRKFKQQLAILYLQTGALLEARNELNSLIADDADDYTSRVLLAQVWLVDGHLTLAQNLLEAVITSFDNSQDHSELTGSDRQVLAAAHCLLGDIRARQHDQAGALREFESALKIDARNVTALTGRGAMLAAVNRWDDAVASFQSAVDLSSNSAAAHNNLAAALARTHRPTEALVHYQRAAALAPESPLAYCNMGALLTTLNRLQEAQQAFREALRLQPDCVPAKDGLAAIEKQRSQAGTQAPVDPGDLPRKETP